MNRNLKFVALIAAGVVMIANVVWGQRRRFSRGSVVAMEPDEIQTEIIHGSGPEMEEIFSPTVKIPTVKNMGFKVADRVPVQTVKVEALEAFISGIDADSQADDILPKAEVLHLKKDEDSAQTA